MKRIWAQDIHSAVTVSCSESELSLLLADSTYYQYWVNSEGQLVRVKGGGGTTVLAVGVKNFHVESRDGAVFCNITFLDGERQELKAVPLATVLNRIQQ